MKKNPLEKGVGLTQMHKDFEHTMIQCMRHINTNHDVDNLCRSFSHRLVELPQSEGERLKY